MTGKSVEMKRQDIPVVDWKKYQETKNKADVLRFLVDSGWMIKRQTFYNHCASGKLRVNRGGVYSSGMVRKYAEKYLIHKAAGTTLEGAEESLAVQKTQREIKRIETQEAHERFKLDLLRGKYLKKSDVYAEWAARAVVIDRGLEYMIEANLAKMIVMVGGDQQKAPQLLEYLIEQKNIQMNEFANMENFRVVMELEEESENVI